MTKFAWKLLRILLWIIGVFVSLILLLLILDPILTDWQERLDKAKEKKLAEERVKNNPWYMHFRENYTESYDSEHFTIMWDPANGDWFKDYAGSFADDCETVYDRFCSDLGLGEDRKQKIDIYAYHDDLIFAVMSGKMVGGYSFWTKEYGDSHIFTYMAGATTATHEILHYLVSEAKDKGLLSPNIFQQMTDTEHLVVTLYADRITATLFADQITCNNWHNRCAPEFIADDANSDFIEKTLYSDWSFDDYSEEKFTVYYTAFEYMMETHSDGNFAVEMIKHCNDEDFPWGLIGKSKEAFLEDFRLWAKSQPASPNEIWKRIDAQLKNGSVDSIDDLIESDMPDGLKTYYLMSLAMYLKEIEREKGDTATKPVGVTPDECLDAMEKAGKSLPPDEQKSINLYAKVLRMNPTTEDLNPGSDFTKMVIEQGGPALSDYAMSLDRKNRKYRRYLMKAYLDKRPLEMNALKRYYYMCNPVEKLKVGARILTHPSVKFIYYSQNVEEQSIIACDKPLCGFRSSRL